MRPPPYTSEPSPGLPASRQDRIGEPVYQLEEQKIGLSEFGAILARRKLIIGITTALFTLGGIAIMVMVKPIYSASTQIFVDPRNRAAFAIEQLTQGQGYDSNLVDSQVVIVESETVLRRVIEQEKLVDDAEFNKGAGNAATNTLRNLKEKVKVKRPERTYVVEVEVRTQNAEKSARIANAIARAYLNDGADTKNETARRETSWLDKHLKDLQGRLKQAEDRVEEFRLANRLIGVDGKLVSEQRMIELNRQMVDAQRKTTEAKAALDQVDLVRRSGRSLESIGEALRSVTIDRLRGQLAEIVRLEANARTTLGPRHPAAIEVQQQLIDTRRLISEELNRIAEGARAAFAVARSNEAQLERQLDKMKTESSATNQIMVQLRDLERAVDAQKAVYQKFLADKEQIARLTVDTPAGRVIASARVPTSKAFPKLPMVMGIAIVGGLFIGIALALFREAFAKPPQPGMMPQMQPVPTTSNPALAVQLHSLPPRTTNHEAFDPGAGHAMPPSHFSGYPSHPQSLPSARRGKWLGATSEQSSAQNKTMADPTYEQAIHMLSARIGEASRIGKPTTLLITGSGQKAPVFQLADDLAAMLSRLGQRCLIIEQAQTERPIPITAQRFTMRLFGRLQDVLAEQTALVGEIYRLPFGGLPANDDAQEIPPPSVILVASPDPAAMAERLETLLPTLDGTIVALPRGASTPDGSAHHWFQTTFGSRLMGYVARVA